MAQENNGDALPAWLEATLFEELLKENVTAYSKINKFKAYPAMAAGENYTTTMLRIEIEVELLDGQAKTLTYMMKIEPDSELFKTFAKEHSVFDAESGMYLEVIAELEQMYRDVGVDIKFGPKSYKLKTDKGNILLEDLRPRGFKNANRLEGLDMEHTKCTLKKLAQFHAASATRVETKGQYPTLFRDGGLNGSAVKKVFREMNEAMAITYKQSMKCYQGHEVYYEDVTKYHSQITDEIYKAYKVNSNEFNVLNHGDLWTNNIMFQYDAFGVIKETYFVDYQGPKYGTPAQDLIYFILSSPCYDLKLKKFDYFVKYYHDQLIEHLNLLKYPKELPTLREIHAALFKYGVWGFHSLVVLMGVLLLDPTENANLDNLISGTSEGKDFKLLMYTSARYRKHAEAILPWLHNRGVFEC